MRPNPIHFFGSNPILGPIIGFKKVGLACPLDPKMDPIRSGWPQKGFKFGFNPIITRIEPDPFLGRVWPSGSKIVLSRVWLALRPKIWVKFGSGWLGSFGRTNWNKLGQKISLFWSFLQMFKDIIWKSLPFVEFPLLKDAIPVWRSNLNGFLTVIIARSFIHIPWIKPPCNWMSLTLCTPYFLSSFCHAFAVLARGRLFWICPVIIKYLNQTINVVWMAYRIYRQMLCLFFQPVFDYKIYSLKLDHLLNYKHYKANACDIGNLFYILSLEHMENKQTKHLPIDSIRHSHNSVTQLPNCVLIAKCDS